MTRLEQQGRIVVTPQGKVRLHKSGGNIIGKLSIHPRGFGFVIPQDPAVGADLFIPEGALSSALSGDTVSCRIRRRHQRDGQLRLEGEIVQIVERGSSKVVGTLSEVRGRLAVMPDGREFHGPVFVPDALSKNAKIGDKCVIEITQYPDEGQPAQGVIAEVLGQSGEPWVETLGIIRQYQIPDQFPPEVLAEVRQEVSRFNVHKELHRREDLSEKTILTIDPDDAKDYDDAISLEFDKHGQAVLGVHIADVSYFVQPGTVLDEEARKRGNSVYFPRHVIPMLPESLSNGLCSLQEGEPRLCKSVFITYDRHARPIHARFANTIIRSAKRLTYTQAQAMIDGKSQNAEQTNRENVAENDNKQSAVERLLHDMDRLARRIRDRRFKDGMVSLDLPEVDLILDDAGHVVDARQTDTSYTHTIIEMFMVEANEAASRQLESAGLKFLRRVHPEPSVIKQADLLHLLSLLGHRYPKMLTRHDLQKLVSTVKGQTTSFAVNLAVLRSMMQAEYSPRTEGHYALASESYAHFTSPIRRYPDLHIHRLLDECLTTGSTGEKPVLRENVAQDDDFKALIALGAHFSDTERRAESAERELKTVKLLQMLSAHVGEEMEGVVSGINRRGLFVQSIRWLIDGFVPLDNMPGEVWQVHPKGGLAHAPRSGQRVRIGDRVRVRIARIDVPLREMDLDWLGTMREPSPKPEMTPSKPVGSKRRKKKK